MTDSDEVRLFHWADYLLFSLSLASTLVIGATFAIKDRWYKQSADSYLLADRQMNIVSVGLSILASTLNATFLVGGTAELHYQGTQMLYLFLGYAGGNLIAAHFFLPKFRRMGVQITSAYEYLERRFHLVARMAAASVFILTMITYLSVVLSAPSLVFAQVSHVSNLYLSVMITGLICTIYTGFGGMKAVIWTDTIQMLIMVAGMIALPVVGIQKAGGWHAAISIYKQGGRVIFDDFDISYWNRLTFWSGTIGQGFLSCAVASSNQMIIQRVLTVKTLGRSVGAMYISQILIGVLFLLIFFIGVATYATYRHCEPMLSGRIKSPDQLISLYIMDVMGHLHGVAGLMVAAVYAASLSTVSSAVNSLSAVFLEDIVKPIYEYRTNKTLNEAQSGWISRILGLAFGVISVVVSIGAVSTGRLLIPLVQISYTLMGAPLFGVFTLGYFCPCANTIGALAGLFSSLAFGTFLFVGNLLYGQNIGDTPLPLEFNKTLCLSPATPNIKTTIQAQETTMGSEFTMSFSPTSMPSIQPIPTIYDLSYQWWSAVMFGVCVITGLLVSLLSKLVMSFCGYQWTIPDRNLLYTRGDVYCLTWPGNGGKRGNNNLEDNRRGDKEKTDSENVKKKQYSNQAFDGETS